MSFHFTSHLNLCKIFSEDEIYSRTDHSIISKVNEYIGTIFHHLNDHGYSFTLRCLLRYMLIHGHLKGERLYLYIYSPWRLYYGRFFSVNSLMSSPWKRFKGIIIFVLWKFLCQFDTSYLENNFSVLIVVVVFKILTFSAPRHQISKFSCDLFNFRSATHCNVYILILIIK